MAATRFLHNFDLLYCEAGGSNKKGGDNPNSDVTEENVHAEGTHEIDFRIVTEEDLLSVRLLGCSSVAEGEATSIASIVEGKAKELLIHGKIPLLVSLVALEAVTGHEIRVAVDYRRRMSGNEGEEKHVYLDTHVPPLKTVGVGFNMEKPGAKAKFDTLLGSSGTTLFDDVLSGTKDLTQAQMYSLLDGEKATYEGAARAHFKNFDALTLEQQGALTELEANLTNVRAFPEMIKAIDSGDFKKGAFELLHNSTGGPSTYVTQVHKGRANNIAGALRWNVLGSAAPVAEVDEPEAPVGEASEHG